MPLFLLRISLRGNREGSQLFINRNNSCPSSTFDLWYPISKSGSWIDLGSKRNPVSEVLTETDIRLLPCHWSCEQLEKWVLAECGQLQFSIEICTNVLLFWKVLRHLSFPHICSEFEAELLLFILIAVDTNYLSTGRVRLPHRHEMPLILKKKCNFCRYPK